MPVMPEETATSGNGGNIGSVTPSASTNDMVDSAKHPANQVMETVRYQASSRADQQRTTLASGLQSVAEAFRHMGSHLQQQQDARPVASYAAQMGQTVGGGIEQVAGYVRDRDVRHMV